VSAEGCKAELDLVPCELCGAKVRFAEFTAHLQTHAEDGASRMVGASSSSLPAAAKRPRGPDVECEECGLKVAFDEMRDHMEAHALEQRLAKQQSESDLGDGTPEALAFRVVELLRDRGQGLPGSGQDLNLKVAPKVGDSVKARWEDGGWWPAKISQVNADGTYGIAWPPPYESWPGEPRQRAADITFASGDGADTREVVNFDVCVRFVRRMMALAKDSEEVSVIPETVFHWTPAQNQQGIIEDSLLVPGEKSSILGQAVQVANGQVLGKGIYTSTDPDFGASYGEGARGAFLCLGLPGRRRGPGQRGAAAASYDSLQNDTVRVYTSSDLLLPCFIAETACAGKLRRILQEVSDMLVRKVAASMGGSFVPGHRVTALWTVASGGDDDWWPATVIAARGQGAYKIRWRPSDDPDEDNKPESQLRLEQADAS